MRGRLFSCQYIIYAYSDVICYVRNVLQPLVISERIEYNLLSLTYKVLTTSQPDYLHNLISVFSLQVELAPHLLLP